MKQSSVLEVKSLSKSFSGRTVVSDVSLNVKRGEVVGLLGPNGAGKTTTFYMTVGLIRADSGSICLLGEDITNGPIHLRAKKGIGYLPQEASIFRDLSVEENIYAILECKTITKRSRKEELDNLLKSFGLEKVRQSKGRALSGGERRRLEIARTLAIDPLFVLLDEPFAGVDPIAVVDLKKIITDLKLRNIGVLITDHNVRETLGIVDRAYIMSDGKLLVNGTPDEIVNDRRAREVYLGEDFTM